MVIPGCSYHVTQRGNRRENVFFGDADRSRYLCLLGEYAEKHGLAVQAFWCCLMTNHVHLVVVPKADTSLGVAVRYVERNPVRAGLVERAEDYPWSSAATRCGMRCEPLLSDPCELTSQIAPHQWAQWLHDPWEDEEQTITRLRQCTHTGRPAGASSFIDRIESIVGRLLRPKKVGRPRKTKK